MAYTDYSSKFRSLRRAWGGRCVWWPCGSSYQLEFCHLRPTRCIGRSRGQKKRYLDIVRNPNCYVLLCRQHHFLLDGLGFKRPAAQTGLADEVPF